ncbi:ATP-binding protein [Paenibacillus filicis]|uniref:histidine kinase n=1 Tax=Paenibacillus gyeongsangnamensis TaxID=3388067 RepID=A0ABT4QCR8_9BACL|nr:ATP-binding protein [Paenibacillus filicis]MCZ8514661.1 ATP-binding protein [Paenibacillus filicis]
MILNQFMINMFSILTMLMLYQVFWIDRLQQLDPKINRILITACSILLAIFCMTHPFKLQDGYIYDLRFVPLIICFLYAGFRHSLFVAAAILLYRFILGGSGIYPSIIATAILLVSLVLGSRRIKPGSRYYNTLLGALLGLFNSILIIGILLGFNLWNWTPLPEQFTRFFLLFTFCYITTLAVVFYVIEQMKQNMEMRRKVQHSDKIRVLSELAASFAHEIRNPMTVARGFMQIMKQTDLPDEKRQIYSQMVLEEMDKTQAIINDYLSFARPTLEAVELLDARALILRAVQSVQTFAELRLVKIETQLEEKLIISANADKFIQCIVNLCKNGIEAMPGGGKLQVVAGLQNQTVCIDIIDQGIGMTNEEIKRLGTPFYSTRGKGTGLGMMVTYRVIQNIQGRIDVTSEVGKGTCFSILIPTIHSNAYH